VWAPANAQTPAQTGTAAKQVYDWRLKPEAGSVSGCASVSGFYAGATDADEFQIFATSLRFSDSQWQVTDITGLQAALASRRAELTMTDDRFNEIVGNFAGYGLLGERADSTCMPIEEHVGDAAQ